MRTGHDRQLTPLIGAVAQPLISPASTEPCAMPHASVHASTLEKSREIIGRRASCAYHSDQCDTRVRRSCGFARMFARVAAVST
jgi:hypothetical protein